MASTALAQEARAVEVGAALYAQHCRTCHGPQGEGVGEMGPPLNDEHFFTGRLAEIGWTGTLQDYIISTTSVGRVTATRPLYAGDGAVAMTAWSQEHGGPLRPDEIASLAAFVLNWEATALGEYEIPPLPTPTPNAAQQQESIVRGEALFTELGCASCHAVDGVSAGGEGPALDGIGAMADARVPGQTARDYLRNSVLAPGETLADAYTEAGTCSALVSEAQMEDLVNFLMGLR